MAKLCVDGKSCKATCISRGKVCQVNLRGQLSDQLTTVRDHLVKMRDIVVSGFRPLVTAEETAKWLLDHRDELATWGMTDFNISETIAHRPAYVTFGVEPGVGEEISHALPELRKTFKTLENAPEVRDQGSKATGPWGDLILKANTYKIVLEGSPKVKNIVPGLDPQVNHFLKVLATAGMNPDVAIKNDGLANTNLKNTTNVMAPGGLFDSRLAAAANKTKLDWAAANGLMMRGAGLTGQGGVNFNPSGLWKPSKDYGQFTTLFEKAGYNKRDIGPFASNGKWYKHSSEKMGDQVMRLVREAQPKLMYFGGDESARVKERLAKEFSEKGSFQLTAPQKDPTKTTTKGYEYFIYNQPDGSRTVALFGPHPGAMGMGSNRKIMEGTGEAAKALIETGKLPDELPSVKVSRVGA
jgi:hypothetical protein